MKKSAVVIFFSVFFSVYGLLNAYIFVHAWNALGEGGVAKAVFAACFVVLATSFIGGRFLERRWISVVSTALIWVGSFWLAAMLYFFLACLLVDLLGLVGLLIPSAGIWLGQISGSSSRDLLVAAIVLVALLLAYGHLNAVRPRVVHLKLEIRKPIPGGKFSIAMASDLHLGTIVGPRRCEEIVKALNALDADVILLPGDLVDEDLGPVIRANLGETLRGLAAPNGVYAVTGNHEYIGGVEPAVRYLRDHGVKMLRDEFAVLPCGITIVGREDRSATMGGVRRKELRQILEGVDRTRPVILLDHQPFRLQEAADAGIDLQLSGHTHHGQLWPLNFITRAVYEVSWGYLKKRDTHYYVSSGVGSWGPPARIGNRPEVIKIEVVSTAVTAER
ncbi:MAG: metallophosphoesterase [Bacteroidota bacterium]